MDDSAPLVALVQEMILDNAFAGAYGVEEISPPSSVPPSQVALATGGNAMTAVGTTPLRARLQHERLSHTHTVTRPPHTTTHTPGSGPPLTSSGGKEGGCAVSGGASGASACSHVTEHGYSRRRGRH